MPSLDDYPDDTPLTEVPEHLIIDAMTVVELESRAKCDDNPKLHYELGIKYEKGEIVKNLLDLEGITNAVYRKLFDYYKNHKPETVNYNQTTLF